MRDKIVKILFFVLLFAIQVLISNYLNLGPYVYICLIPFIILNIPMSTPTWLVMLASFATGLLLDMVSGGVLGLNAAAAVMTAFLRNPIYKATARRDRQDKTEVPSAANIGLSKYVLYMGSCTALYMFTYIFIDCIGTGHLLLIVLKFIASTVLNVVIALLTSRAISERL